LIIFTEKSILKVVKVIKVVNLIKHTILLLNMDLGEALPDVGNKIILTNDQKRVLDQLIEFLKEPISPNINSQIRTIKGYAGTGKTTLTKEIHAWATENNLSVLGVAPTHKARKVLERVLNTNIFSFVQTMTVAKYLNRRKQHSYIGTKSFSRSKERDIEEEYNLILVDECSMISDNDVDDMVKSVQNKSKMIFIGDSAQIPNPSQKYKTNKDGTISKKDSKSFEFITYELTDVIRQSASNPLLKTCTNIRKNLMVDFEIKRDDEMIGGKGIRFYDDHSEFLKKIRKKLRLNRDQLPQYKIIAYTNEMVQFYNKFVRKFLGFTEPFIMGEILMGYNSVGYPNVVIENGQEYIVMDIKHTKSHKIKATQEYTCLEGHIITINSESGKTDVFFPTVNSPKNVAMLTELKRRAEKVNNRGSSIIDYREYMQMKNQLIFMENVYFYKDKIVNESKLKESDPLLFNSVAGYISTKGAMRIKDNKHVKTLVEKYPNLLKDRINDNKPLSESEKLADRYQVIEKDIDYGYAITAHKSQGSTYHTVFIDEDDFEKIGNRWNSRYGAEENGTKEKNQLKYVSYTRPTHIAIVYWS